MAIYDLEEIQEAIAKTKGAIMRALEAHDYTQGSRRVTRELLAELRNHLKYLEIERNKLMGTAGPVIIPGRVGRQ